MDKADELAIAILESFHRRLRELEEAACHGEYETEESQKTSKLLEALKAEAPNG